MFLQSKLMIGLLTVALLGCASGGTSSRSAPVDRDVITSEEIRASNAQTVYHLVLALRPRWLKDRNRQGFGQPSSIALYYEGARVGSAERLREYQTSDMEEIRYLSASEATLRYGTDHTMGAIQLTARRSQ